MIVMLILAAVFAGVAAGMAFYAGRDWVAGKFQRDQEWMRETSLRFSPQPVNAKAYTLGYYAGFLMLLMVLAAVVPNVLIALGFWVLALFIPKQLIEMAWRSRIKKIDGQISQCVATLSNSMRAGLTLVQGIQRLSEQAPEPRA